MKRLIAYLLFLTICLRGISQQAKIHFSNNNLRITYQNQLIFSGTLTVQSKPYAVHQQTQTINNATYQVITITTGNFKSFELTGKVSGNEETIACESEPQDNGLKIVRQVVGKSFSLLNNAVYNRTNDWLLSVDRNSCKTKIIPADNNSYEITITGWEMVIRFRPHYYQQHRGLHYFNPAQYSVWKKPVVGWCSWFAYFDNITEADVKKTADVLSQKLKPYGLTYLQIDDGYQQIPIGMPDTWLHPNQKFPSGLQNLAAYIKQKGLTPGIWTNVSFADSAAAYQHKELFVQNKLKQPAYGNWVGYVMDGSNPSTLNQLFAPVYKGLKDYGWQYFKLDALRHLKYEGYNSYQDFFIQKKTNRNEAFRNVVKEVRQQIGKENFLLACWGIRPELVGIADGCRIGNDGYSYAGLAQFNSYNNIIWRNDPDHIVLSDKEAYRSCTANSLSGSLFMLTDKPEKYEASPLIEAAQKTIPVLYTQPGQVYDVDPSRSNQIALADVEMSGSGPRPFDASTSTITGLFALEINKSFENWIILGRLDNRDKIIPFKDLGLDEHKEYLVYEYWTKSFLGIFKNEFEPGVPDTIHNCQAFCIREKLDHPQIIATSRHITCGGFDLKNVQWKNKNLQGSSETVAGDAYELYICEPDNYTAASVTCDNASIIKEEKNGLVKKITLLPAKGGIINWSILYQ